jgi:hypothetical protein
MLRGCIRYHHSPDQDPADPLASTFVAAANVIAHQCGFNNNQPFLATEMPPAYAEAIQMPEEQLAVIRAVVVKDIEQAQEAFQIK